MTAAPGIDGALGYVRGDMRLDPDLAAHGWCWCPARPDDRLTVELLVNGRAVGRCVADLPRADLRQLGIGDGRHGFHIVLSRFDFDAGEACIVAARALPDGMVFGQLRQDPPSTPAPGAREQALRRSLDDISRRLSALTGTACRPGGPAAGDAQPRVTGSFCVPPLPAAHFVSHAEYLADADANWAVHEARRRQEQRRLDAGMMARHDGTCGPCLRAARFEGCADGAGWSVTQRCDCEDALGAASRILLHAALAEGLLQAWSRVLWLGPSAPLHRRVRALAGSLVVAPDPRGRSMPEVAERSADLIVAAEVLDYAASLPGYLAGLRRFAAPSATLIAAFRFHPQSPVSLEGLGPNRARAIGWDILRQAAEAGWEDARILRVWSRELGYLGPAHFLLRASSDQDRR